MNLRAPFSIVALLLVAACSAASDNRLPSSAEALLRQAPSLQLFALDPTPIARSTTMPAPDDQLHGYAITGRATLTDKAARAQLTELLLRAMRESDGNVAACFNPRHGIRAEHGGRTLDLVICFECLSLAAYGDVLPTGTERASVLISQSVEGEVSRIYAAAGLKLDGR